MRAGPDEVEQLAVFRRTAQQEVGAWSKVPALLASRCMTLDESHAFSEPRLLISGNMSDVVSKLCLTPWILGSFGWLHPVDLRISHGGHSLSEVCSITTETSSVHLVTSPANIGQEAMQRASMTFAAL